MSEYLVKGPLFRQVSADGVKTMKLKCEVTQLSVRSRAAGTTRVQLATTKGKSIKTLRRNQKDDRTEDIKRFHPTSRELIVWKL